MTVPASKLGPGLLSLGETGAAREFGVGLTKCAIEPDYKEGDVIPVLSGDELVEDGEDSYKLTGELFQSYDADSLVAWSWAHHGEEMPFTFTPDKEGALTVEGRVRVIRLEIGGDVKKRNTSKIEWPGIGDPEIVPTA